MDRQAGTRNADRKPFRDEVGDMLVRLPPGTGAEMDRRDRTINAAGAIHPTTTLGPCSDSTGRYRDTAAVLNTAQTTASLNPTTDTVSQLHSKSRSIQSAWSGYLQAARIATLPVQLRLDSTSAVQSNLISPATGQSTRDTRRRNRAWGSSLVRIGVMLLFMFLSFTVTEGVQDGIESSHPRYITTGLLQPRMHSYMRSGEESFSSNKIEGNLATRNQGVLSIRECYVPNVRDTRLASVYWKMLYQLEMTYFNMLRLEDRTLDAYSQIDTALEVMRYKDVDDKFDER